jgi:hypothetical protein
MSREVDFIKDVDDGQELWKLAVRVEDLWKSGIGKNEHSIHFVSSLLFLTNR